MFQRTMATVFEWDGQPCGEICCKSFRPVYVRL